MIEIHSSLCDCDISLQTHERSMDLSCNFFFFENFGAVWWAYHWRIFPHHMSVRIFRLKKLQHWVQFLRHPAKLVPSLSLHSVFSTQQIEIFALVVGHWMSTWKKCRKSWRCEYRYVNACLSQSLVLSCPIPKQMPIRLSSCTRTIFTL